MAYTVVGGILLFSAAWYLIAKTVRRRAGINVSYAFKEVLPERDTLATANRAGPGGPRPGQSRQGAARSRSSNAAVPPIPSLRSPVAQARRWRAMAWCGRGDRRCDPPRGAVRRPRPRHAEGPGAGRAGPDADRPVGRDHEPELPGRRGRHGRALGHPAGRQRHPPPGHLPGGGARRDGRGGRRRGRAGGHRVHPARGLPRHALHRRLAGSATRRSTSPRRCGASRIRSGGSTTARRSRACSCRCASSRRTGRSRWRGASPIPPEYDLAAAVGRRIEMALLSQPDRAAAVPQRPAQRQLHRRRGADPDHRLGIRRDGRPVLRPRELQHQPRADAATRTRSCWRPTTAPSGPTGSRV